MGFSVTAAHVIFFVTLLAAASAAGSALFSVERDVADKTREDWKTQDERTWSNFTVTRDSYDSGAQTLTLTLANEGSTILLVDELEFIVDGIWRTGSVASTSVGGDTATNLWLPGESLTVTLNGIPGPATTIRAVAGNGASAYW